jgi:hypothetical protein
MPNLFPKEFADLEAVGRPWSIGSDKKRHRKHLESSIEDMQVFYDAVLPRAHEILAYCDRFEMRNPPKKVRALMNMLYSLIVVSFPVEAWKQARPPDSRARPAVNGAAASPGRRHRAHTPREQGSPIGGERRYG